MAISLGGLDLSFLRKNDPDTCRPGRYRLDKASGEMLPLAEWHRRNPNAFAGLEAVNVGKPYFMPDVDRAYGGPWKSIIDDTEISSRSNWREHNKRNDVVNVDADYWGKTEDYYVTEIEQRMEYDPSLIGESEVFSWKKPESLKARQDDRPAEYRPDPE